MATNQIDKEVGFQFPLYVMNPIANAINPDQWNEKCQVLKVISSDCMDLRSTVVCSKKDEGIQKMQCSWCVRFGSTKILL